MGNIKSKSHTSATITEEEIEFLLKNTHFKRNEILNWHKQFIVRT